MNITLSVDEKTIQKAKLWAAEHHTSLNSLVREQLERYANLAERQDIAMQFKKNALNAAGSSDGANFSRDEIYSGKRFGTP